LELLAEDPFELSLTDLARQLDIPKASAHRLCETLLEAGMIERYEHTRRYALAAKSLWMGSGYLRHSPVYRAAFFPMQELARTAPGTVQLGVRLGNQVLFIHSVGYPGSPHAFADVGLRRAFHATASGKVLLAAMEWDQAKAILEAGSEKYTDRTITALDVMKQELEEVRQRQYARNVEELLPGFWVLASPVVERGGETVAAISLTLAMEHLGGEKGAQYATLVRDAGRKASLQLGHLLVK